MRDATNRARWSLYTDTLNPVIRVERCDNTAIRPNNPTTSQNNGVECICCASTNNVRDVVIGWNNHPEAKIKNYAEIGSETRSAMCAACRDTLRRML